MNTNKVKGRMVELQITGRDLAKEMNIDQSTFYRKMKDNGESFTLGEITTIKRVLKLDDKTAVDILLA